MGKLFGLLVPLFKGIVELGQTIAENRRVRLARAERKAAKEEKKCPSTPPEP